MTKKEGPGTPGALWQQAKADLLTGTVVRPPIGGFDSLALRE